jgi:hypothetical protein
MAGRLSAGKYIVEFAAQINDLQARRRGWEEQKTRLREMQARHAGRGLLNWLLEERAKERARG